MSEIQPHEANLRTYLQVLARRAAWVVGVTVLAIAVAIAYSAVQKKRYSATTDLLVQPAGATLPGTQNTVSPTDVLTELQLITNNTVKGAVTKKLGFSPSVSATQVGQTNVIALTATAATPGEAAHVANTYAHVFVANQRQNAINQITAAEQQYQRQINTFDSQIASLQTQEGAKGTSSATASADAASIAALESQESVLKEDLAQLQIAATQSPGGITITSPATPPSSPSSPRPLRDGVIALSIGLILGIGAAFSAEYFDDKVYTKAEAERLSGGVPVLAMIPKLKSWKRREEPLLITESDPFSQVTEAYRSLRTSLQFAGADGNLKTILITSASGAEGKSSTTANLGVVLATSGNKVAVVGCDLRRPRVGQFLHQSEALGFTSVLLGQSDLQQALRPVPGTSNLYVLPSGPVPPNPAELLGSERAKRVFEWLAASFDTVLIDSPPLLPVADALVLTRYADAVLLVTAAGETKRSELQRACELLEQANVKPTGLVLNKLVRRSGDPSEYGYTYGYGYTYRPTPHQLPAASTNGKGRARAELADEQAQYRVR